MCIYYVRLIKISQILLNLSLRRQKKVLFFLSPEIKYHNHLNLKTLFCICAQSQISYAQAIAHCLLAHIYFPGNFL